MYLLDIPDSAAIKFAISKPCVTSPVVTECRYNKKMPDWLLFSISYNVLHIKNRALKCHALRVTVTHFGL